MSMTKLRLTIRIIQARCRVSSQNATFLFHIPVKMAGASLAARRCWVMPTRLLEILGPKMSDMYNYIILMVMSMGSIGSMGLSFQFFG